VLTAQAEHAHVVAMAARDDHQIARIIRLDLLERVFVGGVDFAGHREALEIGELLAVVDHADSEAGAVRGFRQGHRNVSATEDIQDRLRQNRFHEDLHGAAADQSVVVAGLIVEIENHLARSFGLEHFFRCRPDFRFDAAASDGSQDGAIFLDEHAGALEARNRAIGVHNGGHYAALAFTAKLKNFLE
jgi:hypothetical protein